MAWGAVGKVSVPVRRLGCLMSLARDWLLVGVHRGVFDLQFLSGE
jgi:hypothetical protein